MCTRPITKDGNTFACRSCDACIAIRRSGWIARAMAEKADWPHALCVALTYNDDTPENRDAAAMFVYDDVRAFLKRLLRSCVYKHPGSRVRFICAGEQGDRDNRCHWHLILYSDIDLTTVGTFSKFGKVVTDRQDLISVGKNKLRRHWSLWGKGFVTLQEPDEGAMSYVLSYCLKDQFTADKSYGTMREAHVENFATGLFRMSKRPAIGENWLMRKLEGLEAAASVLPNLNIKVPEMSGYWHPGGSFRKKLLWGLVALNQRIVWATGANAPQWSALLASCQDNETDLGVLNVYQKEQTQDRSLEAEIAFRQREASDREATRQAKRRCGGQLPCWQCLLGLDGETLGRLGLRRSFDEIGTPAYQSLEGFDSYEERSVASGDGINPHCGNKKGFYQGKAFPLSTRSY